MKNKIQTVLSALCLFAFQNAGAQQEIQNSFYMFNSSVLNPAYAGSRNALSAVLDYRNQWTGWKGAPQTSNFILHSPLRGESVGVGLNVNQDQIGPTKKSAIYADVTYRLRLNKANDRLCFGLRSGVDLTRNQFSSLEMNDKSDPVSSNNANFNTNAFNIGAGIYYYGKRFFLGVTVPKIIPNQLSTDALFAASKQAAHYYLMGGYVWKLNSLWDLKPGFCAKYTPNAPISVDVNLSLLFNDKVWFGVMYRNGAAAGANILYNITKQLRMGYAYDYSLTNMGKYSPSTHEVIIGFDFIPGHKTLKSPGYF